METLAFLGLLGAGYIANNKFGSSSAATAASTEGFEADKTPPGAPTQPGRPRVPNLGTTGGYDLQFQLPSGGMLPSEPNPSKLQATPLHFPVPPTSLPNHSSRTGGNAVQMRTDRWEETPQQREGFVSQLSGVAFNDGEFRHNNMVPFFRGQLKQNTMDTANHSILNDYTGAGKDMFAKREQAPLFEPTREPMGNIYGMEATTEFMGTRTVAPTSRANEAPVEPIRVGPGLNEGFSHLPSGGFQQQAGEEFMLERMPRTDDLRVATNPKLTYATPLVSGAHFVGTGSTVETAGEVRKYAPDTFYINENGERNFVTTGADLKATVRSAQVLKHTARPETTKDYVGGAGQADGKATYTVGSMRTPLTQQMGGYGFRNADASYMFDKNTDAAQNDYGKGGVEIRPNERLFTSERVHTTNLVPVEGGKGNVALQDVAKPTRAEELEDNNWIGMAAPVESQRLTVYDPNDVARTTIKETTEDNEHLGIAAPANMAQKLAVYDPDDIARVTGRNTLSEWDRYRNAGRQDTPAAATVRLEDKVRGTQKGAISAKSAYTGGAESAAKGDYQRDAARAMRHYAQKESVAKGRDAMGSSVKVFNGEDYMKNGAQYRKLVSDSVNDRIPGQDRVRGDPSTMDAIGIQRPRNVLKLDISAVRNEPVVVESLKANPFAISFSK